MAQHPNSTHMTVAHFDDVAERSRLRFPRSGWSSEGPGETDAKWPPWKVTVVVIVFCAAFWGGVSYLAMRLLS